MADSTSPSHPVTTRVMAVAVLGAAVVIVPAAIASYAHMHQLAVAAGEDWLAWLAPLPTDGMVVFASTLLYAQHYRLKQTAHWLVVPAIILGVLASIGANVLSEKPDLVDPMWLGIIVRAWPPLALAIVADLAWQLLGLRDQDVPDRPAAGVEIGQQVNIGTMTIGDRDAFQDAPASRPVDHPEPRPQHHPEAMEAASRELPAGRPKQTRRTRQRTSRVSIPDHEWMPYIGKLRDDLAAQGRPLTGNALKEESRRDGTAPGTVGGTRAQQLVARYLAEQGTSS
jgi:hypothetical protein